MQNIEDLAETKLTRWGKNDGIQYLMKFGLTRMQANLYLNLLCNGKADARLLAHWTRMPRTETYRTLNELQERGLVDREVGSPLKFIAVPPSLGLQVLIEQKSSEIEHLEKNLGEFSREFFERRKEPVQDSDFQITIIEGRKRIITKIKQQHDNAKFSVDVLSFLPRFLQIANESMDNYKRAIARGVKYRILIGLPNKDQQLPDDILDAHKNKNTIVKTVIGNQKINSVIFDKEEVSLSYYPERPIVDSPLILTNHPSLVAFAQNSFEQKWKSL